MRAAPTATATGQPVARDRGKTQCRGGLGTLRLPWNAPNGFGSFSTQLAQQEARRRIDGNGDVAATARCGWSDLRRTRRRKHPPQGAKALKCASFAFEMCEILLEVCYEHKCTLSVLKKHSVQYFKSTLSSFRFVCFQGVLLQMDAGPDPHARRPLPKRPQLDRRES